MKTKVLVTGSKGQLGKTIKELYFKNGNKIEFSFVSKNELNITSKKEIVQYFDKEDFDFCVNCAAYTNVEGAEDNKEDAFLANATAVKHLAETCRDKKIILIHISTDYVFDGKKNEPYVEADLTNPINEYGKSKRLGEIHIQNTLQDYFIIRTSWLYSSYGNNFVKTIINKIQQSSKLKITISQKGTPTSCKDLSKFIFYLIKNQVKNFGVYHFSAQGEITWYDYALHISSQFKSYESTNISTVSSFSSKAKRPKYSVLDNTKVQEIFKDQRQWTESVNEIIKELKSRKQ